MSIYNEIYTIIQTYIFGGLELTATQGLCTELVSLFACIGLIALPFLCIWSMFKLLCKWW